MSNFLENFRVALSGLMSNKLRAALTMLGITIGVASVIVLVSLGQAVEGFVRAQFLGLGANLVIVFSGEDERGDVVRLTMRDYSVISDSFNVPDALLVMPQLVRNNLPTTAGDRSTSGRVRGVDESYLEIRTRSMLEGEFFTREDVEGQARVAVLGIDTAERLFPNTSAVGQEIRVNNVRLRVLGVMNAVGGQGFGGNEDDLIMVPITTALARLAGDRAITGERPITNILVQARDDDSVDAVARQIRLALREDRGIAFRDEDSFEIFTQTDLLETSESIFNLLTLFLGLIAGISLLVGGIGIMNIMLVTVTERTREIGLRKAVGAQRRDIVLQFLTEAVLLSMIGGGIGIAIAAGGALLISVLPTGLSVSVQIGSIMLAVGISVAIGVLFGVYPANRAAALNPIDALRYE
ncbi:MAG: ABC transporter permease [Chloroflexota bacterium]|nr:ABC transporter permease [Chloroflexota bacterium]